LGDKRLGWPSAEHGGKTPASMFYIASKLLWLFVSPINLLLAGAFLGAALSLRRAGWRAPALTLICVVLLIAIGILPLGALIVRPLEDRFALPKPYPADVAGIIVLGGSISDGISRARGETVFDEGGSRLTEAFILARRYPNAKVIYSGGDASLLHPEFWDGPGEAAEGRKLLIALGLAPERVIAEDRSRNTFENAEFTAAIVHPKSDEIWLLVTSAYHMPRSMGLFRKAGFSVVAFPVDYRTFGDGSDWRLAHDVPQNLRLFDLALHEWVGLAGYRLTGKIDEFFPGP
jgi:uncharacterized SAM-binding protein YcdF (DUF218 family)